MEGHLSALLHDKGSAVYTIAPSATVRAAVREMNENGVGALLVLEAGRPVGIFTERDVLRRVVDAGCSPETTLVDDVMTVDLVTAPPSMRAEEAMAIMTQKRLRHLPVVEDGFVVGIISIGDLTRWASLRLEDALRSYEEYITGRTESHPRARLPG